MTRSRFRFHSRFLLSAACLLVAGALPVAQAATSKARAAKAARPAASAASSAVRPTADILRDAPPAAWRTPDPDQVLRMRLSTGDVWIELAPRFAPNHFENISTMVREHYFDGLAILRVQDNFVTQWGDPDADSPKAKPLGGAKPKLGPEFAVDDRRVTINRLKDRDVWAPVTGFVDGFPVGADPRTHEAWIAHCYGVVGAGRGDTVDSGNGAELYVVIGQSPRGLDRNITTVGRVLQGMDLMSSLPRGGPNMGFYDKPEQYVKIERVQRLSDLPVDERPDVKIFRTDTATWNELVESRRNRADTWYVHKAGAIDMCNVSVPVKIVPPKAYAAPTVPAPAPSPRAATPAASASSSSS